jgi:hypothetical protein
VAHGRKQAERIPCNDTTITATNPGASQPPVCPRDQNFDKRQTGQTKGDDDCDVKDQHESTDGSAACPVSTSVSSPSSLVKFTTICRASSRVSRFARRAVRRSVRNRGRSGSARLALETPRLLSCSSNGDGDADGRLEWAILWRYVPKPKPFAFTWSCSAYPSSTIA